MAALAAAVAGVYAGPCDACGNNDDDASDSNGASGMAKAAGAAEAVT
jgi:hypothetical protein